MKIYQYILGALIVLGIGSCNYKSSSAYIGMSHEEVLNNTGSTSDITKKYISEDTIVIGFYDDDAPYEAMYVFKDERCFYQYTKIFCSPCAETLLQRMLDDPDYKFTKIDEVNYQSSINNDIILRVRNEEEAEESCTILQISDISVKP